MGPEVGKMVVELLSAANFEVEAFLDLPCVPVSRDETEAGWMGFDGGAVSTSSELWPRAAFVGVVGIDLCSFDLGTKREKRLTRVGKENRWIEHTLLQEERHRLRQKNHRLRHIPWANRVRHRRVAHHHRRHPVVPFPLSPDSRLRRRWH